MLRTTIAIAAAGVGGADSITALPHTTALGLPDAFARRVARNAQLILLEESSLAKVADPAAGSGAIEALTDEIARAAWTLLQEIEKAGGAAAALEQAADPGQGRRCTRKRTRGGDRTSGNDPLTGTSEYPDIEETPLTVLDVRRAVPASSAAAMTFLPLPRIRLAEPYEALRDKSDAVLQEHGRAAESVPRQSRKGSRISPRAQCSPKISTRRAASRR